MLDENPNVSFDDIAGLEYAKHVLREAVIYPHSNPQLFRGLRAPPRGVLLFGPPGTGKTLLAKAVASESGFRFFSISASTLTSKWVGEGEKLVKALFAEARRVQPAVIFIDEIDSILTKRRENEHEASRRLKTEFLVQLDGAATNTNTEEDRILVMGATNLPQELDDAVLRRLAKRIYIPLPEPSARKALFERLFPADGPVHVQLSTRDTSKVVQLTDGYSCSDITSLCKEAAMGPVREAMSDNVRDMSPDDVRPVHLQDFKDALRKVRPTVSQASLAQFQQWERDN